MSSWQANWRRAAIRGADGALILTWRRSLGQRTVRPPPIALRSARSPPSALLAPREGRHGHGTRLRRFRPFQRRVRRCGRRPDCLRTRPRCLRFIVVCSNTGTWVGTRVCPTSPAIADVGRQQVGEDCLEFRCIFSDFSLVADKESK